MRSTLDFESFYREHFQRVFRFAYFRCGQNRSVAEDLTSEIFLKALNAFDSYDKSISRTAWILTIARNHLINFWRDKKPTVSIDEEGEDVDPDALLLTHSLQMSKKTGLAHEAGQLLERLSPRDRDLVTLHYLDGYTYADIAAQKGLTETSVKVAVHRALKQLRATL